MVDRRLSIDTRILNAGRSARQLEQVLIPVQAINENLLSSQTQVDRLQQSFAQLEQAIPTNLGQRIGGFVTELSGAGEAVEQFVRNNSDRLTEFDRRVGSTVDGILILGEELRSLGGADFNLNAPEFTDSLDFSALNDIPVAIEIARASFEQLIQRVDSSQEGIEAYEQRFRSLANTAGESVSDIIQDLEIFDRQVSQSVDGVAILEERLQQLGQVDLQVDLPDLTQFGEGLQESVQGSLQSLQQLREGADVAVRNADRISQAIAEVDAALSGIEANVDIGDGFTAAATSVDEARQSIEAATTQIAENLERAFGDESPAVDADFIAEEVINRLVRLATTSRDTVEAVEEVGAAARRTQAATTEAGQGTQVLGSAFDQLQQRAADARETLLDAQADTDEYNRVARELIDTLNTQVDRGFLDEGAAIGELQLLANNTRLLVDVQDRAANSANRLIESIRDRRTAETEAAQASADAAQQQANALANQGLAEERLQRQVDNTTAALGRQAATQEELDDATRTLIASLQQQSANGFIDNDELAQSISLLQDLGQDMRLGAEAQIAARNAASDFQTQLDASATAALRLQSVVRPLGSEQDQLADRIRESARALRNADGDVDVLNSSINTLTASIQRQVDLGDIAPGDALARLQRLTSGINLTVEGYQTLERTTRSLQDAIDRATTESEQLSDALASVSDRANIDGLDDGVEMAATNIGRASNAIADSLNRVAEAFDSNEFLDRFEARIDDIAQAVDGGTNQIARGAEFAANALQNLSNSIDTDVADDFFATLQQRISQGLEGAVNEGVSSLTGIPQPVLNLIEGVADRFGILEAITNSTLGNIATTAATVFFPEIVVPLRAVQASLGALTTGIQLFAPLAQAGLQVAAQGFLFLGQQITGIDFAEVTRDLIELGANGFDGLTNAVGRAGDGIRVAGPQIAEDIQAIGLAFQNVAFRVQGLSFTGPVELAAAALPGLLRLVNDPLGVTQSRFIDLQQTIQNFSVQNAIQDFADGFGVAFNQANRNVDENEQRIDELRLAIATLSADGSADIQALEQVSRELGLQLGTTGGQAASFGRGLAEALANSEFLRTAIANVGDVTLGVGNVLDRVNFALPFELAGAAIETVENLYSGFLRTIRESFQTLAALTENISAPFRAAGNILERFNQRFGQSVQAVSAESDEAREAIARIGEELQEQSGVADVAGVAVGSVVGGIARRFSDLADAAAESSFDTPFQRLNEALDASATFVATRSQQISEAIQSTGEVEPERLSAPFEQAADAIDASTAQTVETLRSVADAVQEVENQSREAQLELPFEQAAEVIQSRAEDITASVRRVGEAMAAARPEADVLEQGLGEVAIAAEILGTVAQQLDARVGVARMAIEDFGSSNDEVNQSVRTLLDSLGQQVRLNLTGTDEAIAELQQLTTDGRISLEVIQALEREIGTLQSQFARATDLGQPFEQLQRQVSDAFQAIADDGTAARALQDAARDIVSATQTQIEFEFIGIEEAIAQLQQVADDTRVVIDTQSRAQRLINEYTEALQEQAEASQRLGNEQQQLATRVSQAEAVILNSESAVSDVDAAVRNLIAALNGQVDLGVLAPQDAIRRIFELTGQVNLSVESMNALRSTLANLAPQQTETGRELEVLGDRLQQLETRADNARLAIAGSVDDFDRFQAATRDLVGVLDTQLTLELGDTDGIVSELQAIAADTTVVLETQLQAQQAIDRFTEAQQRAAAETEDTRRQIQNLGTAAEQLQLQVVEANLALRGGAEDADALDDAAQSLIATLRTQVQNNLIDADQVQDGIDRLRELQEDIRLASNLQIDAGRAADEFAEGLRQQAEAAQQTIAQVEPLGTAQEQLARRVDQSTAAIEGGTTATREIDQAVRTLIQSLDDQVSIGEIVPQEAIARLEQLQPSAFTSFEALRDLNQAVVDLGERIPVPATQAEALGNSLQQLDTRASQARATLEANIGTTDDLDAAARRLIQTLQTQVELEGIGAGDAIRDLELLSQNTSLTVDVQRQAANAAQQLQQELNEQATAAREAAEAANDLGTAEERLAEQVNTARAALNNVEGDIEATREATNGLVQAVQQQVRFDLLDADGLRQAIALLEQAGQDIRLSAEAQLSARDAARQLTEQQEELARSSRDVGDLQEQLARRVQDAETVLASNTTTLTQANDAARTLIQSLQVQVDEDAILSQTAISRIQQLIGDGGIAVETIRDAQRAIAELSGETPQAEESVRLTGEAFEQLAVRAAIAEATLDRQESSVRDLDAAYSELVNAIQLQAEFGVISNDQAAESLARLSRNANLSAEQQLGAVRAAASLADNTRNLADQTDGLSNAVLRANLQFELLEAGAERIVDFYREVGRALLDLGLQNEELIRNLTLNLGTDLEARDTFEALNDAFRGTNVQAAEAAESFILLQTRGIDPTIGQVQQLTDLATAQGKSLDQLVEAILDAQAGENERLKELGITVERTGETSQISFRGITREAQNTADSILQTILSFSELEGVAGSSALAAGTLSREVADLERNVREVGDAFVQTVDGPVVFLLEGVNGLIEGFTSLPDPIQQVALAVAGLTAVTVGLTAAAVLLVVAQQSGAAAALAQATTTVGATLAQTAQIPVSVALSAALTGLTGSYAAATGAAATFGAILLANPIGAGVAAAALAATVAVGVLTAGLKAANDEAERTARQSGELSTAIAELRDGIPLASDELETFIQRIDDQEAAGELSARAADTLRNGLQELQEQALVTADAQDRLNNSTIAYTEAVTRIENELDDAEIAALERQANRLSTEEETNDAILAARQSANAELIDEVTIQIAAQNAAISEGVDVEEEEREELADRLRDLLREQAELRIELEEDTVEEIVRINEGRLDALDTQFRQQQLAVRQQQSDRLVTEEQAEREILALQRDFNERRIQESERAISRLRSQLGSAQLEQSDEFASLQENLLSLQEERVNLQIQNEEAVQERINAIQQEAATRRETQFEQERQRLEGFAENLSLGADIASGSSGALDGLFGELQQLDDIAADEELSQERRNQALEVRKRLLNDLANLGVRISDGEGNVLNTEQIGLQLTIRKLEIERQVFELKQRELDVTTQLAALEIQRQIDTERSAVESGEQTDAQDERSQVRITGLEEQLRELDRINQTRDNLLELERGILDVRQQIANVRDPLSDPSSSAQFGSQQSRDLTRNANAGADRLEEQLARGEVGRGNAPTSTNAIAGAGSNIDPSAARELRQQLDEASTSSVELQESSMDATTSIQLQAQAAEHLSTNLESSAQNMQAIAELEAMLRTTAPTGPSSSLPTGDGAAPATPAQINQTVNNVFEFDETGIVAANEGTTTAINTGINGLARLIQNVLAQSRPAAPPSQFA